MLIFPSWRLPFYGQTKRAADRGRRWKRDSSVTIRSGKSYTGGFREKACFLCEVAEGTNDLPQHFVHEDGSSFAILDAYPKAYGYTLVATKRHKETVWVIAAWSRTTPAHLLGPR